MRIVLLATVCLLAIASASAESNADVVNSKVERTVDLTSQLARVSYLLTIENKAAAPLTAYTFVVEPSSSASVAYVGAQLYDAKKSGDGDDDDKDQLSVTKQPANAKGAFYKIDLGAKGAIKAGASGTIEVQVVFINSLRPYPSEITQSERQLVLYKGSSVYYSLYATKSQTTKVNLASDKVEAFTQVKPTSKSDQTITYGPYADVKPFEFNEISVHYENNAPFLRVKNMVRTIEVSHWGNVAVEETIDLEHAGAKLKGSFSRYDYMRKQGAQSSVKSFRVSPNKKILLIFF
jgi:oligosaccharyltransferase complex subunit alpha (ribophorin I)